MISITALLGFLLLAAALGVGFVASYFNVKRSRGPKEKSFVLYVSLVSWAIIASMLGVAYFLKPPLLYFLMAGYFIACPILVYRWSMTHQLIRLAESRDAERN